MQQLSQSEQEEEDIKAVLQASIISNLMFVCICCCVQLLCSDDGAIPIFTHRIVSQRVAPFYIHVDVVSALIAEMLHTSPRHSSPRECRARISLFTPADGLSGIEEQLFVVMTRKSENGFFWKIATFAST